MSWPDPRPPASQARPSPSVALQHFSRPARDWFRASFAEPTPAQARTWAAVAGGGNVLVSAPTGSGKTLAAFLTAIDRLLTTPTAEEAASAGDDLAPRPTGRAAAAPAAVHGRGATARHTRVLYVSPLKALAYDVDRNLRAPLAGITRAAELAGETVPPVSVAIRSGDTSPEERRRLARMPPDILITTPESLYLMLTSRARETLAHVETVIVDEVHAVAGTKRGAHLALSLERLEALTAHAREGAPLQRIGLSATQRPLDEVARFLVGGQVQPDGSWQPRPAEVVDVGATKQLDVEIVVPVEDMSRLGELVEDPPVGPAAGPGESRRSIWPSVHPRILDLILEHRSTIVFCNSRRLSERLCARLNELATERALTEDPELEHEVVIARAHHGSVAREQRVLIEEELKAGRLRCVVATSSLELGIDMGAVDLVVQVESPGSVASGLQRVGRAGHQVGAPSVGKVFPKYRGDLVECAVVVRRMHSGDIEATRYPRNPLDVLAQQIVAMVAMDDWRVEDLHAAVRACAPFADLSRVQLEGVLDMLSGRYPSDEFAELRPRLTWDRIEDKLTARPGAQRLAVTSGGTIPDRGLYGVFLAGEGTGRRVGELDEEMVYESRPGETFTLGSSTWRIEDITRDQVLVTPAPGEPGKLPFWHGDTIGRPVEVGRAVGAFLREVGEDPQAVGRLETEYGLDPLAATNLVQYVAEQREAAEAGGAGGLPTDRQIVIERFRDEIGDWRVCILSPFGRRVHAPWALAIRARVRERLGVDVQTVDADDGIVVRLPDVGSDPDDVLDDLVPDPEEVEQLVVAELSDSALFAARFRECAARALLLPRRRPDGRTPLWQQRQRAADLLAVASRYGSFPILLETYRECLRDVFDLPALVEVLRGVTSRRIRVSRVETPTASPFASSLLFDYIASYMYEGDAPLAERRASALSLDRELLAELLGSEELRELVDPDALDQLELELQRLTPDRQARSIDAIHDLLREIGDLSDHEVAMRIDAEVAAGLAGEPVAERFGDRRDGDVEPAGEPAPAVRRAAAASWLRELERARRVYPVTVAGEARWAAAEDAARFRDALGVPVPIGFPEAFAQPVARPTVDLVARYARTHGPFRTGDVATRLGLPRDAVELALKELEAESRIVAGEFRPGASGREWIDAEVLRRLRRRSLAVLRKEVEPVEPAALVRFLPAWQGVGSKLRGVDRTLEAVEQLQGAPLPASVLERDVLAARVQDYNPAWLDELTAAGEVVWAGRGPLGTGDGRVSLYLRDAAPLLLAPAGGDEESQPWWSQRHAGLLAHLDTRGASFWPQLYQAAGRGEDGSLRAPGAAQQELGLQGSMLSTHRGGDLVGDEAAAADALWDLVWAGLVTNDTLGPLRAAVGGGRPVRARGAQGRGGRPRAVRRPPRALSRSGPPRVAGRWSLVTDLLVPTAPATERATALAAQLLDRYGVLVRDAVAAEDVPGGFSAVYAVLKAMEDAGRARRGYFVEGLGGAQFAVPGAIDRLRAVRESAPAPGAGFGDGDGWLDGGHARDQGPPSAVALAATDPANPFGAALPWPDPHGDAPRSAKRVAGGYVVVRDGRLLVYAERGARSLVTFTDDADDLAAAATALAGLVASGQVARFQLTRVDGSESLDHALVDHLRAAGFTDHPRGLILR